MPAFNGSRYRQRPIADVVEEFRSIPEKRVLVVDDNFVGTGPAQIARAKELFRALADANLGKNWIGQVTINFADDEELLDLAGSPAARGVFIGFESPTAEGLAEVGKKFNLLKGRDFRGLRPAYPGATGSWWSARSSSAWTSTSRASAADRRAPPASTAWTS